MNQINRRGLGWGDRRTRMVVFGLAIAMVATLAAPGTPAVADDGSNSFIDVIVREVAAGTDTAERLVVEAGGSLGDALPLIGGFQATVPASAVAGLAAQAPIATITPDTRLTLLGAGWDDASVLNGQDPISQPSSLYEISKYVKTRDLWSDGYTGDGVDIALIDSGVVPVDGLTWPGKIVNGPDLSFESQYENLRYLDTFGHGTHMAGIIAGRDNAATGDLGGASKDHLVGMAPGARIVSVKVADAHGITDVSQVIAAIDWVVQHGQDDGLNIRVLNLSFGTDSDQSYVLDPLAYAVEQAWQAGIVVVVAAGNDGNSYPLRNPAMDPFVIAVGAIDTNGTFGRSDDVVASFSNCGTALRHVDIVAPGRSLTSLRSPGSYIDVENPHAVVEERFFLGSGTSQAAAVVSGVAALLVDENPSLTPDQVKSALMSSAQTSVSGSEECQGAGAVDASSASQVSPRHSSTQDLLPSTGLGTLEGARGSDHLTAEGVTLEGEIDIMGNPFDTAVWSVTAGAGSAWDGGIWNGGSWSGGSWSGGSWSGVAWASIAWSGTSWTGGSWSGGSWSGGSWSGGSWSGGSWSGGSWSGGSWSGGSWSGGSWSGSAWLSAGGGHTSGLR